MKNPSLHPLYHRWRTMHKRCKDKKHSAFPYYGARGITVCERWNSFELFLSDVGDLPFPGASMDRIDPSGNYDPSNFRWASHKDQTRNTTSNLLLTFNGKTQCLSAWAEELKIPYGRIEMRLRKGWSIKDALSKPKPDLILTFNGESKPLKQWAREIGIKHTTLWNRIKQGWTHEDAITKPKKKNQYA